MYAFLIVEGSNIPHGSVNSLEDLLVDQQLVATDFWTEFDHPTEGRIRMPAIATRFSRTVPEIRRLQPRLSVEVLGEAGFSRLELDELIAIGATRDGRNV